MQTANLNQLEIGGGHLRVTLCAHLKCGSWYNDTMELCRLQKLCCSGDDLVLGGIFPQHSKCLCQDLGGGLSWRNSSFQTERLH